MTEFSKENHDRLIELLTSEKQKIETFYDITQKQEKLLNDEDAKELEESLEKRQGLIREIEALRLETDELAAGYLSYEALLKKDDPKAVKVSGLREEISEILLKIQKLDMANQAVAKEKLDFFRSEIKRLSLNRKGVTLYNQKAGEVSPELFDVKR